MMLSDEELNKTFRELADFLNPKAMQTLNSMFTSLWRQIEDLRASRDRWKLKFIQSKGGNKNGTSNTETN